MINLEYHVYIFGTLQANRLTAAGLSGTVVKSVILEAIDRTLEFCRGHIEPFYDKAENVSRQDRREIVKQFDLSIENSIKAAGLNVNVEL